MNSATYSRDRGSYVLVRFKKSFLAFFLSVFSAVSAAKFSIICISCFFDSICGFVREVVKVRGDSRQSLGACTGEALSWRSVAQPRSRLGKNTGRHGLYSTD